MYNQKEKSEKLGTFFRFEDLRIYNKSLEYVNWIQEITTLFPDNDKSQFVLRFCDAARNIAFFIAEGSARSKPQFINSLKMAKSAIRECVIFTSLAIKQGNITESYEEESRKQLMEMTKMIGALISSLQRSVDSNINSGSTYGNQRYARKISSETTDNNSKYAEVDNVKNKSEIEIEINTL